MSYINLLLIGLGSALVFIWHLFTKSSGVNTQKTIDQVNTLQNKIDDNNKVINDLQKEAISEKSKDSTLQSDSDFFNKR